MKKAYFAAPFLFDESGSLWRDIRAQILGSENRLLVKKHGNNHPVISLDGEEMEYTGPFYYEETANGVFSDSDCFGVVRKELSLIDQCDILIVILDGTLAPGTVSELTYAAIKQKEIRLFYKKESADYDIDSLYWYPIVAAQILNPPSVITPFESLQDLFSHFDLDKMNSYNDDVFQKSCEFKQIR